MSEIGVEERLLNLVALLMKSRRPVSRDTILDEVEGYADASGETAALGRFTRDRKRLAELGIVVRHVVDAWGGGWLIDKTASLLPPISLTAEERLLLETVARAYEGDRGTGKSEFASILSSALFKLRFDNTDERPRDTGDESASPTPTAPGAATGSGGGGQAVVVGASSTIRDDERRNLDLLLEAALARRTVSFRYRRPGDDSAETRTVDPYGMAFVRGAWYLAGFSHERGGDRIFRLSRIEGDAFRAQDGSGPDFEPPADYQVRDTVARLLNPRDTHEADRRFDEVCLRIAPDAAFMVAEWASGDQAPAAAFTRADDGSGRLTLHDPLERTVWRLVAEYAPLATVESPPELRRAIHQRLQAIRARYAGNLP